MVLVIAATTVIVLLAIQVKISNYRANENEVLNKNLDRYEQSRKA